MAVPSKQHATTASRIQPAKYGHDEDPLISFSLPAPEKRLRAKLYIETRRSYLPLPADGPNLSAQDHATMWRPDFPAHDPKLRALHFDKLRNVSMVSGEFCSIIRWSRLHAP